MRKSGGRTLKKYAIKSVKSSIRLADGLVEVAVFLVVTAGSALSYLFFGGLLSTLILGDPAMPGIAKVLGISFNTLVCLLAIIIGGVIWSIQPGSGRSVKRIARYLNLKYGS